MTMESGLVVFWLEGELCEMVYCRGVRGDEGREKRM